MVSQALSLVADTFRDLPWVDKYSGLTRTARRQTVDRDNKRSTQSFPVTIECSADDCWNKSRYKDLVPDSSRKSIVYWEQTGDLPITPLNRKFLSAQTSLRLYCWFNLLALGKDDCDFKSLVFAELVRVFYRKKINLEENEFKISNLKLVPLRLNSFDKSLTHFAKYTYGDLEALFVYPYDFCTIDFELSFTMPVNCFPEIAIGDEIICKPC